MQKSQTLVIRRSEQKKPVIFDRHIPEKGPSRSPFQLEFPPQPAAQIDEMDPLVQQFAAAGNLWVRSPFTVIPHASAMSIPRADIHERSELSCLELTFGVLKGRMKAVIKSYSHHLARFLSGGNNPLDIPHIAPGRFFHQDVFARFKRGHRTDGDGIIWG